MGCANPQAHLAILAQGTFGANEPPYIGRKCPYLSAATAITPAPAGNIYPELSGTQNALSLIFPTYISG